jgi:hypothetical protein
MSLRGFGFRVSGFELTLDKAFILHVEKST